MSLVLNGSSGMTSPQGAVYDGLQMGASVAATSGTSILFSNIPLWVKRITLIFQGVSLSGSSEYLVQVGSGSVKTSGYTSAGIAAYSGASSSPALTSTSGFLASQGIANAGLSVSGAVEIYNISGFIWVSKGLVVSTNGSRGAMTSGYVTLTGSLDRVNLTTVNGTDTFDAGSVNIIYE